ncbi:MAG: nitroreductase family protein [bacterium]
MIAIDNEKCVKCGACAGVCPALVIESVEAGMEPVHEDSCIKCYHCVAVCPESAVSCDEFSIEEFRMINDVDEGIAAGVENQLMSRRSVREFKNKPVSRELLEKLIEIAGHAPTGHNAQAVEFSVISDRELIDSLDTRILKKFDRLVSLAGSTVGETIVAMFAGKKMAKDIIESGTAIKRFLNSEGHGKLHIFRGAPVLIVAHCGAGALTGKDDCVTALCHMLFAAEASGLGGTWIGYLVGAARIDSKLKQPLGVPASNTIHSAMILGWPKYKYKRMIPRKNLPVKWIG